MRVVLAGGTGFIGRGLAVAFSERGDDVTILTRHRPVHPPAKGCCAAAGKVELAEWTPDAPGDWERHIRSADVVVNLAGAGIFDERWTDSRKELLRTSRIRSTELLASAMAAADRKPSVFVSASAVGYYGTDTGDRVLTEEAPPGHDFLATLARDWEGAAAAAREAGVRVVHPRIGLVLGERGGVLGRMVPVFKAFLGGSLGGGGQYMPWIHQRDLVRALEFLIDREDLAGAFNTTAPEPVTMRVFAATLGSALGRPAAFRVPEIALRLALGPGAEALLTGQRAVPRRLVDAGFAFVFPELTSALADIV